MSHSCPSCFELCYCDLEDHDQPPPRDCAHVCDDDDWEGWDDDDFHEAGLLPPEAIVTVTVTNISATDHPGIERELVHKPDSAEEPSGT